MTTRISNPNQWVICIFYNTFFLKHTLDILNCVNGPVLINFDIYGMCSSSSRDEQLLLHPSISTACNNQKIIATEADRKNLEQEIKEVQYETILLKHQIARKFGDETEIASGLKIERVLSVWAHIQKVK